MFSRAVLRLHTAEVSLGSLWRFTGTVAVRGDRVRGADAESCTTAILLRELETRCGRKLIDWSFGD